MRPVGMFGVNNRRPDGRQSMCRQHFLERRNHRNEFPARYPSEPVVKLLRYTLRTEPMGVKEFARRYSNRYGVALDTAYQMLHRLLNDLAGPTLNEETVDRIACLCGIPSIFLLEPEVLGGTDG